MGERIIGIDIARDKARTVIAIVEQGEVLEVIECQTTTWGELRAIIAACIERHAGRAYMEKSDIEWLERRAEKE